METRAVKVINPYNKRISMKVIPGHFATNHSHINYYIDMTTLKVRQQEAYAVAKILTQEYVTTTVVDTIVCMDGCEIIGAYLAEELNSVGIMSMNSHQSIYIVTPEANSTGQLIFRDNLQRMVKNKHVLLLVDSMTTGKTIERSLECIEYYGGIISGISAIFSAVDSIQGYPINSVFKTTDIPGYKTYPHNNCPLCKGQVPIDAIINSYGYSKLF